MYPQETITEKGICTPVFITELFAITRTWKQPQCPSTDEWIKKMWYICAMEYNSAIKRNTFESFLMRWMNLEPIIQSEISQREKQMSYTNAYIWNLEKMVLMILFTGKQRRHRHKEQTFRHSGGRRL